MCHNTTERSQRMTIVIIRPDFIRIHYPVVPPLIVVRDPPIVRTVGDKRVLLPQIVVIWAIRQEIQRLPVGVGGEGVGEAAVGVQVALFAAELRWVGGCEEDAVLGGHVDIFGGILDGSCELLEA